MKEFPDPEHLETQALHGLISFEGTRVLEVGCGDGRMMRHYAGEAGYVCGLDFDPEELAAAQAADLGRLPRRAGLALGRAEALPYADASFDIVVLGWSLCCVAAPFQRKALRESARVARRAVLDIRADLEPPEIWLATAQGDEVKCGSLARTPGDSHDNQGATSAVTEALEAGWLAAREQRNFDWIDVYATVDEMVGEITGEWQSWNIEEDLALRLLRQIETSDQGAVPFVRQGVRAQLLIKPTA